MPDFPPVRFARGNNPVSTAPQCESYDEQSALDAIFDDSIRIVKSSSDSGEIEATFAQTPLALRVVPLELHQPTPAL
jgi:hypothetical protein